MFSLCGILRHAGKASARSAAKDSRHTFFNQAHEPVIWRGEMAELLGLKKFAEEEYFNNSLAGFYPDGSKPLVQNAGAPDRQGAYLGSDAGPKAFSVLYGMSRPARREDLRVCFRLAETAVFGSLEQNVPMAAIGTRDEVTKQSGLLIATRFHISSQSNDPHVHSDFAIFNLCVRDDGKITGIKIVHAYQNQRALTAIFETELAFQLKTRLGLTITPLEKGGFHIEGVPKALCEELSNRRAAINRELAEHPTTNPKAARIASLNSRPDKDPVSKEALFARWQKIGKSFGFDEESAERLFNQRSSEKKPKNDFHKAYSDGFAKIPKHEHRGPKPIELGRRLAIEHGATSEDLKKAFDTHLPKGKGLVHVEWKPLFKKAPFWSPAKQVKTPRLVFFNLKPFRRWGDILWEKNSLFGRARIQSRYVFPNAPRFNPLSKLTLPALRYGKMRVRENEQWGHTKYSKKVTGGEIRIQSRKLFPRALPWNPLKHARVPVPRFVPNKTQSEVAANKQFQQQNRNH